MPFSSPLAVARSAVNASPLSWWRRWWRRQTPVLQDAVAMLAPMAAVLLFLAAIVSAFWYLRNEEIERETESVKRDTELTALLALAAAVLLVAGAGLSVLWFGRMA